MRKLLSVLGLCALLVPASSFAAYLSAGRSPFINPSKAIQDNAYIAGGSVTVSGPINGDLLTAGGTLFISSKIARDIMAAGGTINISGASAEDVRVAGGTLVIGGNFRGELVAVGGQVTVTPDAEITKDSYMGGGTLVFNGNEAGNLTMSGGEIDVNGNIAKNLTIKSTGQLTIGSGAIIKGNLEYSAPLEATIEPGARISGATLFHKVEGPAANNNLGAGFLLGLLSLWLLIKLLLTLTITYLVWYIWKKDSVSVVGEARSRFGKSLLRGFLFLVAMPVAIIMVLMTVLGTLVGVLGIMIYVAVLILAVPAAVLLTASIILKKWVDLRWYDILLGAVVISVVRIIPLIGGIAFFIVYLAALGALLNVLKPKFRRS